MTADTPMTEAFWTCEVGPTDRALLPGGSDLPMRMAVRAAFRELTGGDPEHLSSGWGRREARADLDKLREAVVDLANAGNHRPDCPQSEWGGTKPACDCGWEAAEDAADRALGEGQE